MPAPTEVLDLINGLEAGREDVTSKAAQKQAADDAAANAHAAAQAAADALRDSKARLALGLTAAHARLDELYGGV